MSDLHPLKQRILDVYGKEPAGLDDLARCVMAIINSNCKTPILGFKWNMTHGTVSNTHSCPLNGVRNWNNSPDKPIRYPGWTGRVWIRYADGTGRGSEHFNGTLTYPGTGGFGGYDGDWEQVYKAYMKVHRYRRGKPEVYPEPQIYSWDYRFYDSDWPDLYKPFLFDMLAGKGYPTRHMFSWNDPVTRIRDEEFMLGLEQGA